jgi:8-oxo-dGTP diphosphatase
MPLVKEGKMDFDGQTIYAYNFPRPSVAVDLVIFGGLDKVILIKRKNPPFQDHWALPGGFLELDETSQQTARREVREETGLNLYSVHFVGVYDEPERDPRGRVISIAYTAFTDPEQVQPKAGSDAKDVRWLSLQDSAVLNQLAFDHKQIIRDAMEKAHEHYCMG